MRSGYSPLTLGWILAAVAATLLVAFAGYANYADQQRLKAAFADRLDGTGGQSIAIPPCSVTFGGRR